MSADRSYVGTRRVASAQGRAGARWRRRERAFEAHPSIDTALLEWQAAMLHLRLCYLLVDLALGDDGG